jgi:hypothetical protein
VAHDVRLRLQLARHGDAGLLIDADDLAEIAAGLVRIDVDCADEFHPGFRQQKPRDLGADRADAVLRDRDGLNVHGSSLTENERALYRSSQLTADSSQGPGPVS